MHNLPPPVGNRRSVFCDCASRTSEPGRTAILDGAPDVFTGFEEYIEFAEHGQLEGIRPHTEMGDNNKANHEKLYSNHFSSRRGCHYATYSSLRRTSTTYRCPYCSFGRIRVVDHFLPKSFFFRYSVFLDNLVPCCRDCNTEKDDSFSRPGDGTIFHPYFDQTPDFKWLKADFTPEPFSTGFSVLEGVADPVKIRLQNQLETFNLAENYSELAANYYTNILPDLSLVARATDPIGENLLDHLIGLRKQALVDFGGDVNNWKVTFLEELINVANSEERGADFFSSLWHLGV